MAFTEFYVQTTGSNLNSGSSNTDAALLTFTNGNWDATTGIFTATGADLSGVTVGMFASVYNDGATLAVYVGRITAVDDTLDTITVSLTAKSGTAPTTNATGRSIKIGGAWKGPNAAEIFPFGFAAATMINSSNDICRVNIKGGTTYNITASLAHSVAGPLVFQGYTTSAGDLGQATIDGGTTAMVLINVTGANVELCDLIAQNNGTTGSNNGIVSSAIIRRCVANNIRGNGIFNSGHTIECEAYACNGSNTSAFGGFSTSGGGWFVRCISHDNTGSNSSGFTTSGGAQSVTFVNCIFESNGQYGAFINFRGNFALILGCDFYNNTSDGINFNVNTSAGANITIENCNFVKNGGWGFNDAEATLAHLIRLVNCGFGSGTQANTSGTVTGLADYGYEEGSITYAADVTPWVDPANGDFRVNLAAAKNAGRGTFTQTASGYAGTIGYPDVGAATHLDVLPPSTYRIINNSLISGQT